MLDKMSVKVEGHRGTWYVVEELVKFGKTFYLLEHNIYGEDASWVAVDAEEKLVMEDITEGASELAEYLDAHYMV